MREYREDMWFRTDNPANHTVAIFVNEISGAGFSNLEQIRMPGLNCLSIGRGRNKISLALAMRRVYPRRLTVCQRQRIDNIFNESLIMAIL